MIKKHIKMIIIILSVVLMGLPFICQSIAYGVVIGNFTDEDINGYIRVTTDYNPGGYTRKSVTVNIIVNGQNQQTITKYYQKNIGKIQISIYNDDYCYKDEGVVVKASSGYYQHNVTPVQRNQYSYIVSDIDNKGNVTINVKLQSKVDYKIKYVIDGVEKSTENIENGIPGEHIKYKRPSDFEDILNPSKYYIENESELDSYKIEKGKEYTVNYKSKVNYNVEYYVGGVKLNLYERVEDADLGTPINYQRPAGLESKYKLDCITLDGTKVTDEKVTKEANEKTYRVNYVDETNKVAYVIKYKCDNYYWWRDDTFRGEAPVGSYVDIPKPSELGKSFIIDHISNNHTIVPNITLNQYNNEYYVQYVNGTHYKIEYYLNNELYEEATDDGYVKYGEIINTKTIDDLKISNKYKLKKIYNANGIEASQMIINENTEYKVHYISAVELITEAQIEWRRSKPFTISKGILEWDWNDIIGKGDIKVDEEGNEEWPYTENKDVWDGMYNMYAPTYTQDAKYKLNYDYATWNHSEANVTAIRFQGEFDIPEGYTGRDFIKIKASNQESYININNGKIVPINDNMFVFVHKKDIKLDNNNFYKYLAFWTGTVNGNSNSGYSNNSSVQIKNYRGMDGTSAYRFRNYVQSESKYYQQLIQTDGWFCETPYDNIGSKMHEAQAGDTYIIDVIVQDNSASGGMDKIIIEFIKNTAPTAVDDNYVCAAGETLRITNEGYSVLKNDSSNNEITGSSKMTAELITNNLYYNKDKGGYELKDKSNKTLGYLCNFNENGMFTFIPEGNRYGVAEFKYRCVDGREKSEATSRIYVLPYAQALHILVDGNNQEIKAVERVYGWAEVDGLEWKDDWIWPKYITNKTLFNESIKDENGIVIAVKNVSVSIATEKTKAQYEFSFNSYNNYINNYVLNTNNSPESNNIPKGNIPAKDNIKLYYKPASNTVFVNYVVKYDGKEDAEILKSHNTNRTVKIGDRYDDFINTCISKKIIGYNYTGYSINAEGLTLNSAMPSDNITVGLYYELKECPYTIYYYIKGNLYNQPYTGTARFGTEINNYKYYIDNKINEINASKEFAGAGKYVELDSISNFPCTINDPDGDELYEDYDIRNNIIRVYMVEQSGTYDNYFTVDINGEDRLSMAEGFVYIFCTEFNGKGKYEVRLSLSKEEQYTSGIDMKYIKLKIEPIGLSNDNSVKQDDGSYIVTVDRSSMLYKVRIEVDDKAKDDRGWFDKTNMYLVSECKMIQNKSGTDVDINIGTMENKITLVPRPDLD